MAAKDVETSEKQAKAKAKDNDKTAKDTKAPATSSKSKGSKSKLGASKAKAKDEVPPTKPEHLDDISILNQRMGFTQAEPQKEA